MADAFYEDLGSGRFASTPATAGPWSADAQHGGPPSALVTRAMERCEPDAGQRIGRVAVDILRPVPVAPLDVRVRVVRPGRRITLLEAVASSDGVEVVHGRAWRIATSPPGGEPPRVGDDVPPPPLPDPQPPIAWTGAFGDGYLAAVEWRFVTGGFEQRGPAKAWMRSPTPLVAGEETSAACRVMVLADCGSGVSASLDASRWLFLNVDLTVVLHRPPVGEWVLIDAVTTVDAGGIGLATTNLADQRGSIGTALQTLLVAAR